MNKIVRLCAYGILTASTLVPASAANGEQDSARPYSLHGTELQTFHSNSLGIDYLIYISLPRGYEKQTESYPIVFVLDADYCFPIVHDIAWFLADHDEVRPLIIVGIAYPGVAQEKYGPIFKLNRTRDYTPTHVATGGYGADIQKQSGGADHYLDFLERELTPYLESKFRVKHDRTIIGYSYGGLLASYAMLTRPALFQRFIIVSPSLWYDNHMIFRTEQHALLSNNDLHALAFFSVGGRETSRFGDKEMVKDLGSFAEKLRAQKYPNFRSQLWVAEGETHHSVFPGAAMRGIRFVFSATKEVRTERKTLRKCVKSTKDFPSDKIRNETY